MKFRLFRRKLSDPFKEKHSEPSNRRDVSVSQIFDPSDLEMLKNRAPKEKKPTTKSEYVNLFRSQLHSNHSQG